MVPMRSLLGYLVLDQPRQRYTHWVEALAPLTGPGAPPPLQVDAYFVAMEDRALLALWYLAGDGEAAALVSEVTRLGEIYVIDPACLSDPDRRILQDRLAECEVIVDRRTSIADALGELVKRARELRALPLPTGTAPARTITGRRAMTSSMGGPMARDSSSVLAAAQIQAERAETQGWMRAEDEAAGLAAPAGAREGREVSGLQNLRGLRDSREDLRETRELREGREVSGLQNLRGLRDSRDDLRSAAPGLRDSRDDLHPSSRLGHPAGTRNDLSPLSPSSPLLPRSRRSTGLSAPAAGAARSDEALASSLGMTLPSAPTMPPPRSGAGGAGGGMSADGLATSAATSARTSRERRARTEATTDPFLLAFQAKSQAFSARYLRGARWLPAQLSQLSIDGAQLSAVSLPRLGDFIYLALAFGDADVALRAEVSYVADEGEAQRNGDAFFQVKFTLDDLGHQRLLALLLRARQANAELTPPPPRASRRSALVWPVMLATPRGSIRAELLDLSERGLFAHPLRELELEGNIGFSLMLDDQATSISGRAQVVRRLESNEAKERGLRSGYGLELTDLAGSHRVPWERFVARVRRRAGTRVLVGAPSSRFEDLSGGLVAAGYSVLGSVEPASVAQLAEASGRPPDAAVLDSEWMAAGGHAAWIESLLVARGIRCLVCHGDARRAYGDLDRLLGVT